MTGCAYRMSCLGRGAARLLAAMSLFAALSAIAVPAGAATPAAATAAARATPLRPDGIAGRSSGRREAARCKTVAEVVGEQEALERGAASRRRCDLAVAVAVSIRSHPGIF
jgi:hypothetical protein